MTLLDIQRYIIKCAYNGLHILVTVSVHQWIHIQVPLDIQQYTMKDAYNGLVTYSIYGFSIR